MVRCQWPHHRPHFRGDFCGPLHRDWPPWPTATAMGMAHIRRVVLLRDVVGLRANAWRRRPRWLPATSRSTAQHRPVSVLWRRSKRVDAASLLRGTKHSLVRQRCICNIFLTLHFSGHRPRCAVGHQPPPVGPVHETLCHIVIRGMHNVRAATYRAAVDGSRPKARLRHPSPPRSPHRARIQLDGPQGFREQMEHGT